ncbi:hypothetical protein GR212_08190 [Rhizobium lusitanum]|uniref:Uncharacterized protein n=1 Tax=Rhizobium lusitanum TaxID=293958 RepID=A0A6L9U4W4_9HYPH|nr:hypothetical protein [Rhizobium lusitanum]NEI69548.1 hypothetical protein [Rhizobium lusitanum]
MSIFLRLHEIAARRGDGLRPELLAGLKRSDTKAKFQVVAIEQKLLTLEPRHSRETVQEAVREGSMSPK